MATAISDRALDLGVFALDYELEVGTDDSDAMYHAPFNESVDIQLDTFHLSE